MHNSSADCIEYIKEKKPNIIVEESVEFILNFAKRTITPKRIGVIAEEWASSFPFYLADVLKNAFIQECCEALGGEHD